MFLTTVPKRLGGGSWNLVTFNINLFSIKKSYFWFPRLSSVTIATSLSGGTRGFLKLSFHMFPYNEILKVFKSKIWVDIWRKHLKIPLKYQISEKSIRGFGSYEHLKFRPMRRLKYRLWRHNDVTVVTSQIFCYNSVEYIKLDTCVKFHDHRSNNNKVMKGGPHSTPPWLTVQKKPMSNRVKDFWSFETNVAFLNNCSNTYLNSS